MLRKVVLGFGFVCLAASAIVLVAVGIGPAFPLLIWGAIIAGGIIYERFRYKALETATPGPGWEKTSERFIDDESGKPVTVFVHPETGERRYVKE